MTSNTVMDISEDIPRSKEYRKQILNYITIKIPFGLIPGVFSMIYIYFFWDYLGLNQTLYNIAMIIYALFNALNDPLLGQWSDRIDIKKWGSRRLIFIKYGGPLWAIIFFFMWFPWSYDNQIIIFLHFVIALFFFDNMLSLVIIVWDALLPEIAETYEDRNKIFFWAGIIGTIASIPVLFSITLVQNNPIGFRIFTGVIAILSIIIFYVTASNLKEKPEYHQENNTPGVIQSLIQCFKSRGFVIFTLYRFFRVITETMLFSFIFIYSLLFPTGWETILLVALTIAGMLGSWIFVKLSEKYEMQSLIMWGRFLEILISITAFFFSIQAGLDIIWYSLFFIKLVLGGYIVFMNPYIYLVADEDEIKYDTRREGMFLGTNAIFNKIAESLGPIIGVGILVAFGYLNNAPEGYIPSEQAFFGIKFLLLIMPCIFDLLGMIVLHFYPIKGERLKELQEKIHLLHEKKKKEYLVKQSEEVI
ncbi:MFS transporter [Candidatus Lokiarchaeum ossiferum]|uniref:MFS transporter n=1 Tax=Candidatus Lokiarchaeum ossiferum TaxID=2951803 RepID=UPI00352EE34D